MSKEPEGTLSINPCPVCNGKGYLPDHQEPTLELRCSSCAGTGQRPTIGVPSQGPTSKTMGDK